MIEMPAPHAYSMTLKYGIALNTAIMFSGKTQSIAVVGGGVTTPSKKPFKKLKSHCRGVKRSVKNPAIFAKIY